MGDFRNRQEWSRTANIMALIANCNRDPKKRPAPYTPGDFGPYAKTPSRNGILVTKDNIDLLRAAFEQGKEPTP
ncbi:MAG: hypothetical protein NT031_20555 [Planctomycetota bacterium]|nr:hypothetical protein [Planctomycetota bacterium]